ncbi:hypothetical protein GGH99_008636 [Coemansia sp. RSA 1285]|nr:hypothetical protein GGH99_008636 [Coemansia sp. RSA 1285]
MHSPPQQQHQNQNQNQNQQHKQMPISSYTYAAGSAAGSRSSGTTDSKVNQERLNALRERILGSRSSGQSSHALQTQQASAAPESNASKLPSRLAGPSDTVPNMDDIRQKIALMRNSLRNQKQ